MDNKEKELIEREKLLVDDKNLFVMAGAGAGKTYSLVHRIIKSLDSGAKTSEIVAISFTNKSAEELRERIINELNKINSVHLDTIDEMTISTIHKFCINILRENSIYANLSPDFSLIDDDSDRINYVLKNYLKGFNNWDDFDIYNKKYYSISEDIKDYYLSLINYVDKIDIDNVIRDEIEPSGLIDNMKDALLNIYNIVRDKKYYLLELSGKDELDEIFSLGGRIFNNEDLDIDLVFKDISINKEFKVFNGNKFRKKDVKPIYDEICEEINEYRDIYLDNKNKLNICYNNEIFKYSYEVYVKYLDYINNDCNNITNNQAIYLAMKLLDNKDICKKLHNKYKHIYIDEYQDTDHMQYIIATKLTKINGEFPDDSALFLVGDPKQSIYRFRGAEPELYKSTMEEYKCDKNCNIYELDINFRSNSKILEYVNNVYSKDSMKLTNPNSNEYSKMLCADKNIINDKDINDVNLIGFYNYVFNNDTKLEELIRLIKYIKFKRFIRDSSGKYRNIEYKDIMIMMKDHKKMPLYVKILNENNIPTKVSGESDFGLLFSVRAFISLFESLNTRGPKSKEMAYEVFKNVFYNEFVNLNKDEEKILLTKYYNKLKYDVYNMSSYGIAIYLIKHLNWIIKENSKVEDYILNSIISKLYQMVESVFSSDYLNGNDLSKKFREYLDDDGYVEYESLTDNDSDAVSVINVHKSKGLEAPICIWICDDNKGNNSKWYKNNKLYYKDLILNDDICDELNIDDDLELNRLEYVAATRAKEAFIFFNDGDIKGMFSNPDYDINLLDRIEIEDVEDVINKDINDYLVTDNDYIIDDKSLKIISPSSLENNKSLTREKLKVGNNIKSNRPVGNILGTILHRSLELLILNKDINNSIIKAIEENIDDINDYDSYYDFISSCVIETDNYYKDKGYYNLKLYPELSFSYLKDNNLISNGSIDLLLIDGNNIKIIDYKSDCAEYIEDDNVFEVTLNEKYKPQLDLYEETIKDLFKDKNINVIKSIIYFRNYDNKNKKVRIKEYILE